MATAAAAHAVQPTSGDPPAAGWRLNRQRESCMSFDDLAAGLRGELVTRDAPNYDEVRAIYNAMIDKKPAALARCVDAADVQTCVNYARENGVPSGNSRRRPQRGRPGTGGRRTRDRPFTHARNSCQRQRADHSRRGWVRVGRCGSRRPPLRAHGSCGDHLHHRLRRTHPRRWSGTPVAKIRAHHRQFARGGSGARRRVHGRGERE